MTAPMSGRAASLCSDSVSSHLETQCGVEPQTMALQAISRTGETCVLEWVAGSETASLGPQPSALPLSYTHDQGGGRDTTSKAASI